MYQSIINHRYRLAAVLCAMALLATGCGKAGKVVDAASEKASAVASSASAATAEGYKFSLKDGPAACLNAYKEKIGQSFKILDFSTYYILPETIGNTTPYKGTQGGEMKTCDIKVQDPANDKKVVGYRMNMKTGAIEGPIPVEITVSGNAESFKLSEVVFPAENIDFAAIQANIDALKPKLDQKYSVYQVSGIRMDSNLRTGKPQFLVHIDGKLKANDVKKSEMLTLSPDGKKVLGNSLN